MGNYQECEGPRGCHGYELGAVVELSNYVMKRAYGGEPNYGQCYAFMYNSKNLENIRVIKVNHQIISSITIFRSVVRLNHLELDFGGISTVVTHPDFVGKGYSTLLMRDCLDKMKHDGVDVAHLTTPIPDYYRKQGWEHAGQEYVYKIDNGNVGFLPNIEGLSIIKCSADEHLGQLSSIYGTAGLGAKRTEEDFYLKTFSRSNLIYAAEKQGGIVGYVILSGNTVIEHIGESTVTAGIIRYLFEQRVRENPTKSTDPKNSPSWDIVCPSTQDGLGRYLDEIGFPRSVHYLGMLYIPDPNRLLQKIGYSDVTVKQDDGAGFELSNGITTAKLTRGELTKLIYGPERVNLLGASWQPAPLYQWPADKV